MARVFVSYRRDDTQPVAGRLYDHLVAELGEGNVFKDVNSIELGDDFRRSIFEAIGKSDVSLILIGDKWLAADAEGKRRLDDPGDFVRLEVEASLRRSIPVIPVLVRGATMPAASDLPPTLRPLAFRQAAPLRPDPDFTNDVNRIGRWIEAGRGPGVFGYDPRVYFTNLGMVAGLLAFVVFWMARYTGWFGGGAGNAAVALAGFFSLMLVLFKVVPEARIRPLRSWLEKRLLIHPRARFVLLGFFLLAAVGFSFFGAIQITTPSGDSPREITFVDIGDGTPGPLSAGRLVETLRTTLWSPRRVVVHVSDLPRLTVTVRPWQVKRLTVPRSFFKPVVLVRCRSAVADTAAKAVDDDEWEFTYRVVVDGEVVASGPFIGRTLCLGADKSMGISESVRAKWRSIWEERFPSVSRESLRDYWFHLSDGLELDLAVGARLSVEVWATVSEGQPFLFGNSSEIELEDPNESDSFPQAVAIHGL